MTLASLVESTMYNSTWPLYRQKVYTPVGNAPGLNAAELSLVNH